MRRDSRRREKSGNNYNLFYVGGSILALGIIAFVITFVVYGNKMDRQAELDNQKIAALVQQSSKEAQEIEEVSTQMGKTVDESKNEIQNTVTNSTNIENTKTNTTKETIAKETQNTVKKEETTKSTTTEKEIKKETKKEVLTFIKPVEGEITKNYAKDSLIYSETLEEWTTHLGWDIKADKTTVVKASAEGTVKSIKNDPRYGLSIIIEHDDGYQTLYANLLSTEFVQVGEKVKQGQSLGTVGNTAAFEIADEPHLHFEITKNGENIDPNSLVK